MQTRKRSRTWSLHYHTDNNSAKIRKKIALAWPVSHPASRVLAQWYIGYEYSPSTRIFYVHSLWNNHRRNRHHHHQQWHNHRHQRTMNKEEERKHKKRTAERKNPFHIGLKKTKIENKIAQNRGWLQKKSCNNSRRNVIFPQFFSHFFGPSLLVLVREIPVCRDQIYGRRRTVMSITMSSSIR